jgi:hypothetical protein
MPTPVRAWSTLSSQGTTTYETVLYDDGTLSCDCPGWKFSRNGKPRACKHTKRYQSESEAPVPHVRRASPPPPAPRLSVVPTCPGGRAYSFDNEEESA